MGWRAGISSAARRVKVSSKMNRIDADIDEVRNAINQGAGLAGAGAGDNQQRPLDRRGRLILSVVKFFAIVEA